MNAREELLADNARKVAHRFFLRIGQAKRAAPPENPSLPLFDLPLMLSEPFSASGDPKQPDDVDSLYLSRCEALIREAAEALRA